MKIVIDARESGTSTGRYVDKLIENLAAIQAGRLEFKFTILTKPERVAQLKLWAPNFEIIESDFKEFTLAEQIGFWRQVKAQKADLVHFTATQQPVLYSGKVVTTIHDLTTARSRNPAKNKFVFSAKQAVYKWVIKRVARKSVALITASQFVKNDVAQYAEIPPDKIHVTYEAADKIAAVPKLVAVLTPGSFIMYVGRPLPHKNLERLIEAFATIRQSHPQLQLVLAGKKDLLFERLEQGTRQKGVQGVIFPGFVSEGQLRWLYENTAAYIFPSLSEGFGLPGLEAMMHGAPVVASNATCLPEIYGAAALYFDPQNPGDMAQKISQVLDDKKIAQGLSQKGLAQAQKYSWRKTAEETLAIYRQVLNT